MFWFLYYIMLNENVLESFWGLHLDDLTFQVGLFKANGGNPMSQDVQKTMEVGNLPV